mmetsp:Transcript_31140/g.46481  ORF Transcript_31140/g.46481 Transcript_31140/m.46481 type:complete len:201 (+) Transcript_31140:3362-3964(+)
MNGLDCTILEKVHLATLVEWMKEGEELSSFFDFVVVPSAHALPCPDNIVDFHSLYYLNQLTLMEHPSLNDDDNDAAEMYQTQMVSQEVVADSSHCYYSYLISSSSLAVDVVYERRHPAVMLSDNHHAVVVHLLPDPHCWMLHHHHHHYQQLFHCQYYYYNVSALHNHHDWTMISPHPNFVVAAHCCSIHPPHDSNGHHWH